MGTRPNSKKAEERKKKVMPPRDQRSICPICGSPMLRKTIYYIDWNDGHVLVVSEVPVRECRKCGHQFLHAGVAKKIERLFELDRQHVLHPKEMIETPVVDLNMVA